jgi:hypothetical protein
MTASLSPRDFEDLEDGGLDLVRQAVIMPNGLRGSGYG